MLRVRWLLPEENTMKMLRIACFTAALIVAASLGAQNQPAQNRPPSNPNSADAQNRAAGGAQNTIVIKQGSERWMELPASSLKGTPSVPLGGTLRMAVLQGDPAVAGRPYTIRLSCSSGTKVAPHWHPADENITVIKGDFAIGMGSRWNDASLQDAGTGGYAFTPARMNHFATCKSDAVLQIYGNGPFEINFVSAQQGGTTSSRR